MLVDTSIRLADGDHVVQFYAGDDELVGVVGGYLAAAVLDGDAVVVIAAPSHRDAFRVALVTAGVDVESAKAAGWLTMLDAAETLSRFMADGMPDPSRFAEVIGELVGPTAVNGRQVRVYGELVALLWDAGHVAGAIELERMWNELGAEVPFSLFCAYPAHMVSDAHSADDFAEVCHLHSEVVAGAPTPAGADVTRRFAGTSQAPRLARQFVTETLRQWRLIDLVEDAVLVVSELATNAVMHAKSDLMVALSRRGDGILVAVADASSALPQPREADSMAAGGRGLRLVGAMATRNGHDLVDGGKVVWAELAVGVSPAGI